jgi:hypothetical protein
MHMSTSGGSNYPSVCFDLGMDCISCVQETARESAKVCPGLKGKAIGQIFVLLYPKAACAPMHQQFAVEYLRAPGELDVAPLDRPMERPSNHRAINHKIPKQPRSPEAKGKISAAVA